MDLYLQSPIEKRVTSLCTFLYRKYKFQLCLIVYWLKSFISCQVVESQLYLLFRPIIIFLPTFSMQTFKPINFKRCAMLHCSFKDYLQAINSFVFKQKMNFCFRLYWLIRSFIPFLRFKWHHLSILCLWRIKTFRCFI